MTIEVDAPVFVEDGYGHAGKWSTVTAVYKNGNFTTAHTGRQQFRNSGYATGGGFHSPICFFGDEGKARENEITDRRRNLKARSDFYALADALRAVARRDDAKDIWPKVPQWMKDMISKDAPK